MLPTLRLLPIKLLSLWLIGQGKVFCGTLLILLAKLAGTVIGARMFSLTQPALMQLATSPRPNRPPFLEASRVVKLLCIR